MAAGRRRHKMLAENEISQCGMHVANRTDVLADLAGPYPDTVGQVNRRRTDGRADGNHGLGAQRRSDRRRHRGRPQGPRRTALRAGRGHRAGRSGDSGRSHGAAATSPTGNKVVRTGCVMSQLLTPFTVPLDRREVPAVRETAGTSDRPSPQRARRPDRPRFVFSPALVQYFAELHRRQVRIDSRHTSTRTPSDAGTSSARSPAARQLTIG